MAAGQAVKAQGKIVLATVKGDVHDIGKNIVGVVLACNNYEVIDLGVMVSSRKNSRARQAGEGRHDRPERPHHSLARRDGPCGPGDGAPGVQAALLIGGATTSRAHTAVKIAPHYSEPVVHVLDASRAVPVTTSLLSDEGKAEFVAQHRADYEALRKIALGAATARSCRSRQRARGGRRSNGARKTCRCRSSPACACCDDFPLATLREFIDWTPFFHTWELKGVYPRIFEHESHGAQARQIFAEANALLDRIIAEKTHHRARRLWLFSRKCSGRRRRAVHRCDAHDRCSSDFHFLRQQANREGSEPCRSLADFIAPRETGLRDHIGAFAVTSGIGLKELCDRFRPITTTTTRSWPRRSPTDWPKLSPNACTSGSR